MAKKQDKDFHSFSELPFSKINNEKNSAHNQCIIKKKNVNLDGTVRAIKISDNKGEPQIVCNEKDGIIDSIEITCICGEKIKLQLKTSNETKAKKK